MQIKMKRMIMVLLAMVFVCFLLGAAQPDPMMPINWPEVIAYFINTVLVYLAVMGLSRAMPIIREKYGFLVPLATPIIALVISTVAKVIGDLLGYPIDFSAITAVITGTTAVWAHQLGYQFTAKKRN